MKHVCTYPNCRCPFDSPGTSGWCALGLVTELDAYLSMKNPTFRLDPESLYPYERWIAEGDGITATGWTPERAHQNWIEARDRATQNAEVVKRLEGTNGRQSTP